MSRRAPAGTRPPLYVAPTGRRVFLGKTADTEYLRQLDGFLYDYHLGDRAIPRATKYKFDFGPHGVTDKDYAAVIPQQNFTVAKGAFSKRGADFYRVAPDSRFCVLRRFGWQDTHGLQAEDRRRPDALRRDFVCGAVPAVFCIDLPRGQYQLLFLIGDAMAETAVSIEVRDQFRWCTPRPLRAGQFAVEVLPVRMVRDDLLAIHLSGQRRSSWKLNALMVNRTP